MFIANTLKCRPPDNRDPQPNEIEACHDYLRRQVDLIEPTVICTLGQLLDQAAAGRQHRDLTPARSRGGAHHRPPGGPPVSALPPGGGAVHAVDARDAARRLPTGSPICWRSGRPSSRRGPSRYPSSTTRRLTTRRTRDVGVGATPSRRPSSACSSSGNRLGGSGSRGGRARICSKARRRRRALAPRVRAGGSVGRLGRAFSGRSAIPNAIRAPTAWTASTTVGEPLAAPSAPAAAASARPPRPHRAGARTTCASARACTGPRGRCREHRERDPEDEQRVDRQQALGAERGANQQRWHPNA